MNRVLKTFLLWLLIAALPVQGIAAVVRASCGSQHHQPAVTMAVAGHHHDDAGAHHHHSHASDNVGFDSADREMAGSSIDESEDTQGLHTTSYCSACAACCIGAAAPPSPKVSTLAPGSSESAAVTPAVSFTGFIPPGLERPPRQFSI